MSFAEGRGESFYETLQGLAFLCFQKLSRLKPSSFASMPPVPWREGSGAILYTLNDVDSTPVGDRNKYNRPP
jgi:hypothetical protein